VRNNKKSSRLRLPYKVKAVSSDFNYKNIAALANIRELFASISHILPKWINIRSISSAEIIASFVMLAPRPDEFR
jgi:hypothetical protein